MDNSLSTGRSRRNVSKRITFSPEPSGPLPPKKAEPKRKSNAGEKKKTPLPVIEDAKVALDRNSPALETPEVSPAVGKKQAPKSAPKAVKKVESTPASTQRRGLLALKRYSPQPETPKVSPVKTSPLIPAVSEAPSTSTIPETPQNIAPEPTSSIPASFGLRTARERKAPPSKEFDPSSHFPRQPTAPKKQVSPQKVTPKKGELKAIIKPQNAPSETSKVEPEAPLKKLSFSIPKTLKAKPNEVENDEIMEVDVPGVPKKQIEEPSEIISKSPKPAPDLADTLPEKSAALNEPPLLPPNPPSWADTVAKSHLSPEKQQEAEIQSPVAVAEPPKPKVTPLKISRPRPSLPAIPVFSASPPAPTPIPERKSFSGRRYKPAASREYPGHNESLPGIAAANAAAAARKPRTKPSKTSLTFQPSYPITPGPMTAPIAAPTSLQDFVRSIQSTLQFPSTSSMMSYDSAPNTPPVTAKISRSSDLPPDLAALLPERPNRHKSKNIVELAPSLVSKDLKRKSLASSGGPTMFTNTFNFPPFGTSKVNLHSPPPRQPRKSKERLTSPKIVQPSKVEDVEMEEDDYEFDQSFESGVIEYGEDAIEYLENLHPHLKESLKKLEANFDNYLLREVLTEDIISSADSTSKEDPILDLEIDDHIPRRRAYTPTLYTTLPHAQDIANLNPSHPRITLEEAELHIQKFYEAHDPTGLTLKILCDITRQQCALEHTVANSPNAEVLYYLYSLQNGTKLRSKLVLHFSRQMIRAHEWILENLEVGQLASYLMVLKYLKAAGTTMGDAFLTEGKPEAQQANQCVSEALEDKIRDPYIKMLTQLDRKLKFDNIYLMLIVPGVKLKNEALSSVYHAHEQIFVGLTNMGCAIEKIVIKEEDYWPEKVKISQVCDYATTFIRNTIIDAVKRRPNDRIFVATWGVTCLFVHEAILEVSGVTGIIDLAIPTRTSLGHRGLVGDKILHTYCPTMVIIGDKAENADLGATSAMLENFNIATGLCVIGDADDSLVVKTKTLAKYGITQACVNRMILNHIMDFIEKVTVDTKNGIHTNRLEYDYPYIVDIDFNEHVMRDENSYGYDDDFLKHEPIEDGPKKVKPKVNLPIPPVPAKPEASKVPTKKPSKPKPQPPVNQKRPHPPGFRPYIPGGTGPRIMGPTIRGPSGYRMTSIGPMRAPFAAPPRPIHIPPTAVKVQATPSPLIPPEMEEPDDILKEFIDEGFIAAPSTVAASTPPPTPMVEQPQPHITYSMHSVHYTHSEAMEVDTTGEKDEEQLAFDEEMERESKAAAAALEDLAEDNDDYRY